jgi:phosphate transport system permease protein
VTVTESIVPTSAERRELIHQISRRSYRRRRVYSGLFVGVVSTTLLIAFVPLFSIFDNVIGKGIHVVDWAFLTTPQKLPGVVFDRNDIGGVSNAITGTILVDLIALAIAIPVAMCLAVALFEAKSRAASALRLTVETMVGLPSILFGLFIYIVLVNSSHHYTALAGSLALALLMVPLMTVACEAALRDVPSTLTEAALALGAKPSKIMRRVILPYAFPRMLTGILLSLSRAVGETAPVLLVIGANMLTNWDPFSAQTTLPTLTFTYVAANSPALRNACWGIALILITAVFIISLTSRVITARTSKGR